MRLEFDPVKSQKLRSNPRRGIGFEEAFGFLGEDFVRDRISDDPEQHRAIGIIQRKLYTIIYEERTDTEGDYIRMVTLWQSTRTERSHYDDNV